nr:hypothetical protein [Alloyangia mangrovi]
MAARGARAVITPPAHGGAGGQVEPEHHGVAQPLGDQPAEQRADQPGDGVDGRDIGAVAGAFRHRHAVGDDDEGQGDHAARPGALHQPGEHQQREAGGECAKHRSGKEEPVGNEQRLPPSAQVGDGAVERRGHGGGDEVAGGDPAEQRAAAEAIQDIRQHRADDGLLERRDEERQKRRRQQPRRAASEEAEAARTGGRLDWFGNGVCHGVSAGSRG